MRAAPPAWFVEHGWGIRVLTEYAVLQPGPVFGQGLLPTGQGWILAIATRGGRIGPRRGDLWP